MNTGTVLIVEVTYETDSELKVFNLDTGQDEEFRKSKNYKKLSATEAKLLPPKVNVDGKRPEGLEAVQAVPLTSNTPELFKRLGTYPENLAKYLAWSVGKTAKGDRLTVAVLPIRDNRGQATGETVRRAEELTGALARRGVEMVERSRLDQVVGELVKQQGAAFDNALAQQVGRQVGASAVVVGSLSPRGEKSDLNLRLVDVATGSLLDSPSVTDITGLVRERTPIGFGPAAPSFVGKWNLEFSNGRKGALEAFPNKTLVMSNGARGRWDQTGNELTILVARPGPAKKAGPGFVKFLGGIGPRGGGFRARNDDGVVVSGSRP